MRGKTQLVQAQEEWAVDLNSGSYKRTVNSVLKGFIEQVEPSHVEEIHTQDIRKYARSLKERGLAASTAEKNFAIVRSWLEWCVHEEIIRTNPAKSNEAQNPLPTTESGSSPQFWHSNDRDYLLARMDELVDRINEEEVDLDVDTVRRDTVLCYMIGLTGVRGAEVLDNSDDEHPLRRGLRWQHVHLDDKEIVVLGKTREKEEVGLMPSVVDRLARWKKRLDPPSGDWPVFPNLYIPTLSRDLKEDLEATGYSPGGEIHPIDHARENGIVPPSISVRSGRETVKKYSQRWDLPKQGDGEWLKLHGGRRLLGDEIYESDAELAQDILRHKSLETTHTNYRQRRAGERADQAAELLGKND